MPNLKTSIKDLRSTKRKTVFNDRLRNRVKKSVKNIKDDLNKGETKKAADALKKAYKVIDKAAKKNVISKGKASRKKSRLAAQINKLSKNNEQTTQKDS